MKKTERIFESTLWATRFIVLLGVIFGLVAAIALFVSGSVDIVLALQKAYAAGPGSSTDLVASLIGAIDLYLIGVVMLIFSFGIYELFISKLEIARENEDVNILEIKSLDELKNRILKVVVMVLVVAFFKKALDATFSSPLELLYLALSILALSMGVYFMHKD